MAKAIFSAAKELSPDNLSGRTVDGINTELQLHWAAYKIGIMKGNAKDANIGGMKQGKDGYDNNAWLFETVQLADDIINPMERIDTIKAIWGYLRQ